MFLGQSVSQKSETVEGKIRKDKDRYWRCRFK